MATDVPGVSVKIDWDKIDWKTLQESAAKAQEAWAAQAQAMSKLAKLGAAGQLYPTGEVPDEENDVLVAPASTTKTKLLDFDPDDQGDDEGNLVEAAVSGTIHKLFEAAKHPRWPKGTGKRAGEFMRAGQSFVDKDGKRWQILNVTRSGAYAAEASGKEQQAETRLFKATKGAAPGEGVAVPNVKPAPPKKLWTGVHAAGTVSSPAVVPYVESSTHDPSIKLPEGSKIGPDQWKRFGRQDQEYYVELQERFGKWSASSAKSLMTKIFNQYDSEVQHTLQAAFNMQYGSSGYAYTAGNYGGLATNLAYLFETVSEANPQQMQKTWNRYEKVKVALDDINEALHWDLYNRTRSPDIAVFHGGESGVSKYEKQYLSGKEAIYAGWSQSPSFQKATPWGSTIMATPVAIRLVNLSSYTPMPGVSAMGGVGGEHEIGVGVRMRLDKRSKAFLAHEMGVSSPAAKSALITWINGETGSQPASGAILQELQDVWDGKGNIPIPEEKPNLAPYSEADAGYKEPPKAVIDQAVAMVKGLKYKSESGAPTDTKEGAVGQLETMGLKPGDFIEGLKGTRYLIIEDANDPHGLRYVKVMDKSGTPGYSGVTFPLSSSAGNNFYRLAGHVDIPKEKKKGFVGFSKAQYDKLAKGAKKPMAEFTPDEMFTLDGEGYKVLQAPMGGKLKVQSLDTGKMFTINSLYKGVPLVPQEDFVPPPPPAPDFVPAKGEKVIAPAVPGAHLLSPWVGPVASVDEGSQSATVVDPHGVTQTVPLVDLAPVAYKVAEAKVGDIFPFEGNKFVITNVLKNGTVKAKQPGGHVQAFEPDHEALRDLVRIGDYQIGEKAKAGQLAAGQLVSSSGAKAHPYEVLGQVMSGKKVSLRNLETGEIVLSTKQKGWHLLSKPEVVESPDALVVAPGEKAVHVDVEPGEDAYTLGPVKSFKDMEIGEKGWHGVPNEPGASLWEKSGPKQLTAIAGATNYPKGSKVPYDVPGTFTVLVPKDAGTPGVADFDAAGEVMFKDMPVGQMFTTKAYAGVYQKTSEAELMVVTPPKGSPTGPHTTTKWALPEYGFLALAPKGSDAPQAGAPKMAFKDMPVGWTFKNSHGLWFQKTSPDTAVGKSGSSLGNTVNFATPTAKAFVYEVVSLPAPKVVPAEPTAPASKFDPSNYVDGDEVLLKDVPEGTIFKSATGIPMKLKSKAPKKGATAVALHNGKLVKNIPYDKPLTQLVEKAQMDSLPHVMWLKGDKVPFDKLEVGDQYQLAPGLAVVQVTKKDGPGKYEIAQVQPGGATLAHSGPAHPPFGGGTSDPVIFKGVAQPVTPAPAEVTADDLPSVPDSFEPYKAHKSGTAKHYKLGTLPAGQSFVDKAGGLWKVKSQAGSVPIITNGEENFTAPPDAFVKLAEDAGVAPLAKEGPALGDAMDWKSKQAEDKLVPNVKNFTLGELGLLPGQTFKTAWGVHKVQSTTPGWTTAGHVETGVKKQFLNSVVPQAIPKSSTSAAPPAELAKGGWVLLKTGTLHNQPSPEWFHVVGADKGGNLTLDNKIGGTVNVTTGQVLDVYGGGEPPVYKFKQGDKVVLPGGEVGMVVKHSLKGLAEVEQEGGIFPHSEGVLKLAGPSDTDTVPLKVTHEGTPAQMQLGHYVTALKQFDSAQRAKALAFLSDADLAKVSQFVEKQKPVTPSLAQVKKAVANEGAARAAASDTTPAFAVGDKVKIVGGAWAGQMGTVMEAPSYAPKEMYVAVKTDDGKEGLLLPDEAAPLGPEPHAELKPGQYAELPPGFYEQLSDDGYIALSGKESPEHVQLKDLPVGAFYAYKDAEENVKKPWQVNLITQAGTNVKSIDSTGQSGSPPSPFYVPPAFMLPREAQPHAVSSDNIAVGDLIDFKPDGHVHAPDGYLVTGVGDDWFAALNPETGTDGTYEKKNVPQVYPRGTLPTATFADVPPDGFFLTAGAVWQRIGANPSAKIVQKVSPTQMADVGFPAMMPGGEKVTPLPKWGGTEAEPSEPESPLVPFLHGKAGKSKHHKLGSLGVGEEFTDKAKKKYTVMAKHAMVDPQNDTVTFEDEDGNQFQSPASSWVKATGEIGSAAKFSDPAPAPEPEEKPELKQVQVNHVSELEVGDEYTVPGYGLTWKVIEKTGEGPAAEATVQLVGKLEGDKGLNLELGDTSSIDGPIEIKVTRAVKQPTGSAAPWESWPLTELKSWKSSYTTGGKYKYPPLKALAPGTAATMKDGSTWHVVYVMGDRVLLKHAETGALVAADPNTHVLPV